MFFKKATHVIFDLDGLIIDSESIFSKIIGEIIAPFGKEYTADLRLKILGTPATTIASIVIEEMCLPYTVEQFLERFRFRANKELQHPQLMAGAKKLLEHLHKHKIPIAVATSSTQDSLKLKTQDHQDLLSLFHHVVCGATDPEVKHGKPAPDIFLVCAERFPDKPKSEQCLVLEDAPNGAKGALEAGMQVVLVPHPDIPEESRKPATLVVNSLLEFKPEKFGLPPFEN